MIDKNYFWQIVFFLAIGTIAIRFSIIGVSARLKIPERVKEMFSYIPAAILPALVAPMVFFHQGTVEWAYKKERFLVLALTTVVSYFTKSTLTAIVFGLSLLYILRP